MKLNTDKPINRAIYALLILTFILIFIILLCKYPEIMGITIILIIIYVAIYNALSPSDEEDYDNNDDYYP